MFLPLSIRFWNILVGTFFFLHALVRALVRALVPQVSKSAGQRVGSTRKVYDLDSDGVDVVRSLADYTKGVL